jgi:hypothetical protein
MKHGIPAIALTTIRSECRLRFRAGPIKRTPNQNAPNRLIEIQPAEIKSIARSVDVLRKNEISLLANISQERFALPHLAPGRGRPVQ